MIKFSKYQSIGNKFSWIDSICNPISNSHHFNLLIETSFSQWIIYNRLTFFKTHLTCKNISFSECSQRIIVVIKNRKWSFSVKIITKINNTKFYKLSCIVLTCSFSKMCIFSNNNCSVIILFKIPCPSNGQSILQK